MIKKILEGHGISPGAQEKARVKHQKSALKGDFIHEITSLILESF